MPVSLRRFAYILVATAASLAVVSCYVASSTNRSEPLVAAGTARFVPSPIKVHLKDGSVILYAHGATVGGAEVSGSGLRYSVLGAAVGSATTIPMDSILGIESIQREVNPGRTLLYGTVTGVAAAAGTAIGTLVLAVAIFGSCPTIYSDSAGTPVLQAESFSYSIAPLLGKRDVDRLQVAPDSNGVIRLEVRNEALETHYIDQMELVEARHETDEMVFPVARGGLVAVRNQRLPLGVVDGSGRNVSDALERSDEYAFRSADAAIAHGADGTGPVEDHLDIVVPREPGRDSLAVILRMRSSLLATTVFYEHMLARHGSRALDWVGEDLSHITAVAQLARWYSGQFGLRVSVLDGDEWKPVVRLLDFGPTAWRDVAAIVTGAKGDSVHLRLSFVPDEFRIDRVATSWDVRPIEPRTIHVARVTGSQGQDQPDARDFLLAADGRSLVTSPGDRLYLHFDVGTARPGTRTWLIAADGYYVEWVRPQWIASATDTMPFTPQTTSRDILKSWMASRTDLESRFFRDRVPVR